MRKKRYFSRGVMFLLCAVFAVLFLLPTVLTITNSFMSESEIRSNYGMIFSTTQGGYVSEKVNLKFIPDKVTLSQYITGLIKSPEYLLKFWNSVLLVLPIVVLQVTIAAVAAYSFTRWRGRIRNSIFFFYVILMLMPYQVTLVPNFLVSKWLGILNTRWSIILPGMFAPFSVFLLTKFMRRIPYSLIESAKVDGAGE
ncbi:MAG: carbohydrate ABC transporter permease, partial [Oscillospiraceae bacterium]|nr:carbohydrate ABC transporter permease [Oscillospiraceae bacterium]